MPLGGPILNKNVWGPIFKQGLPIDQSLEKWKTYKGVRSVIEKNTHKDKEFIPQVHRTLEWCNKQTPLHYTSQFTKEELEEMDVVNLDLAIPFANQKVLKILDEICPQGYDAFPIEIKTPTGTSKKYFLINITNKIENALDKPNCIYKTAIFKKEGEENSLGFCKRLLLKNNCMGSHHLGRLHERMDRIMMSKKLVDRFELEGVYGFNRVIFEDHFNRLFRSNYLPDGKGLKV